MDLFKWFIKRRKSRSLDLAYKQMTYAIETVAELKKSIDAFSMGDKKEVNDCIDRLFLKHVEIDDLRRTVFEESTRGNLPSRDREDIMHLVKRLDVMADHVKDSARNVKILVDAQVPREVWSHYMNIAKVLVECADTLWESIDKVRREPTQAIELAQRVDQMEGKVDEEYLKTKAIFFKYFNVVDPATLLVLKDLLETLEHVADSCDNTADYVRIIAVAREVESP